MHCESTAFWHAFADMGAVSDNKADELTHSNKQHVSEPHSAYADPRDIESVDDLPKTLTKPIPPRRQPGGAALSSSMVGEVPAVGRLADRLLQSVG